MGSSCEVKIEIDRSSTGGTFTNYDIISGIVTLIVTNSISLNCIQVKLEGISKTELSIPKERRNKERKDKLLLDIHKVLYDTCIVFPPDNVRQVSQAKEFTLTPGNYTYPFEFKLPLNNSCIKLSGITNKVSFNKMSFDTIINNGNFNTALLKNKAQQYYQAHNGKSQQGPTTLQQQQSNYHITAQLPPSLSGMNEFASIKYFVKVTCKRSSFLKTNLRAIDPFILLPLDLDSQNRPLFNGGDYEEYREVFFRKELAFKNRIPDIVGIKIPPEATQKKVLPKIPYVPPKKQGFFQKLLDPNPSFTPIPPVPIHKKQSPHSYYPEIESKDVPFAFEVRFRHPAFLIPTKVPSFKLFLVSILKPSRYTLSQYGRPEESNGLGVVYLQKLIVELTSTTIVSVLETDGVVNEIHRGKHDEVIPICNNSYQNYKFDLMNCKKSKSSSATSANSALPLSYELEIPKSLFENCVLPDHLSPSFITCNISRKYYLSIIAGFSSEKIVDFRDNKELERKIKYVDLRCSDIKVLSGLNMTSALHSNASKTSLLRASSSSIHKLPNPTDSGKCSSLSVDGSEKQSPPVPPRPSANSSSLSSQSSDPATTEDHPYQLPTYDDVMRESSFQNDGEHLEARRRYQQHEQYYNNID